MEKGVWLEASTFYKGYTWGLLGFTLRRVEEELESGGLYMCDWELDRVEGGRAARIYGRGRMWPDLGGGGASLDK